MTAFDFVETVDKVGNGGFACAGGTYKSNLLAGFGVETDVVENGLAGNIAEYHVVETDISRQRNQRTIRTLPGPLAGSILCLLQGAVGPLAHIDQGGLALVHLRCDLHDLKDPLRTGDGCQHVIDLLADHTHRLTHLTDVLEIHDQGAKIQAHVDGEQGSSAAGKSVVDMGNVAHGRHNGARKGLGRRGAAAICFIALGKALPCLGLVVENLDDLLTLDHLLDIAIDNPDIPLLFRKKVAAALAHGHYHKEHEAQTEDGHQEQYRAGNDHHEHHAHESEAAGDQAGKAVVHDLGDGLDVVGIAAHEFAMGMGVKIAQRQGLHLGKEIPPECKAGLLGDVDHDPGVGEGEARSCHIDAGHEAQGPGQLAVISGDNRLIHQRLEEVGSADGAHTVEHQAYSDNQQQPFGAAQIFHQFPNGFAHIFGFLIPVTVPAAGAAHGPWISHRYSLLPAGIDRRPDRSRWFSSVRRECPWRRSFRHP